MPQPDIYDQVSYPGSTNPQTHPNRLAVMALLHGLHPAPVAHCRVLEIGCNEGRNLIPMAYAIPGSRFVGFDLAAQPIARGQQRIQQLGLTNITLFQADLMQIDDSLGVFDYIIAHGVYAWVPDPVRDGLLALCRRLLSPHGVAFISYNALPGGHIRNLIRDILLQPGVTPNGIQTGAQTVTQSLDFLQFIIDARPADDPFRTVIESEVKRLHKKSPHALFHDELAPFFKPVSITTFATHAAAHNLQYLCESQLPSPTDPIYNPKIAGPVKAQANGDRIAEEQILDFARMRLFRETLLCHASAPADPDLSVEALANLRLASQADSVPPENAPENPSGNPNARAYRLPGGITMQSHEPTTILLMDHLLAAWPESIPMQQIEQFLNSHHIALDPAVITLIFRLVTARMIDLYAWTAPLSRHIPAHPIASLAARQYAADATDDPPRTPTLVHTSISISDPLVRSLLLLLDGTKDRAVLIEALQSAHPEIPASTIAEGFDNSLLLLHSASVLLAPASV